MFLFISFELCLFDPGRSHTGCALSSIALLKYNEDFIDNFSDFWTEIMPKYNHILIVGDCNAHM